MAWVRIKTGPDPDLPLHHHGGQFSTGDVLRVSAKELASFGFKFDVVNDGRDEATDAACRLAEEHGLDIDQIIGTGKDRTVIVPDVQKVLDDRKEAEEYRKRRV